MEEENKLTTFVYALSVSIMLFGVIWDKVQVSCCNWWVVNPGVVFSKLLSWEWTLCIDCEIFFALATWKGWDPFYYY